MNWENPLQKFRCNFNGNTLTLSVGNEKITFNGSVLSLITETNEKLHPSSSWQWIGDVLTLSGAEIPRNDCKICEVRWFDGEWSGVEEIRTASTEYSDICVFLRTENYSFFLSLDFPYSKIINTTVTYDPYDNIKAGEKYSVHTLSIGAAMLCNTQIGNYDRAEIEAMSAYIDVRVPPRFDRSIFSSTSITNQMTDVRDGRIFYSMYNNPTLTLDPETLKKEVRLCAELGIEYYQLFEGYYDWEEDGSSESALSEIVALGKQLGVRIGDYMTPSILNCWHYNYHVRTIKNDDWRVLDENGARGQLCYGRDELIDYLKNTIVKSIKKHGEQFICLDGNAVMPCFDKNHNHAPGMYAQVRGLVRFIEAMNETDPQFLTWSNSGNWLEFMPKLLWYNQNVYLTDPHPRNYSSSLNTLKYYGDCRREQMVSVHNNYFVPYHYYTNCEYYAFPYSRVDDTAFFEYSFLQGLCVTPNICLGEMRTFYDRIPASKTDYCKAFMKKWMSFVKDNYKIFKNVYQLGDAPSAGANEAYAHIIGDKGWLCFVNQNPYSQTFDFLLDSSIGLNAGKQFLLTEEYPQVCPISEQTLPFTAYGEKISIKTPAYSVRIIRIEPYIAPEKGVRLYGIEGKIEQKNNELNIFAAGECGKRYPCALVFENGKGTKIITSKTLKTVPMYTFETGVENIKICGNVARFDIVMPRDYFQREITLWSVGDNGIMASLNHSNSDFCGGYIHNFYKEQQKTALHITTGETKISASSCFEPDITVPQCSFPRRASVYTAKLNIPFIEWPVMARGYGFDEIMELIFTDINCVKDIKAFIDGTPCEIRTYNYPCSQQMKTFYIELIGKVKSGTGPELRLEVEWNNEAITKPEKQEKKKTDAFVIGQ